MFKIYFEAYFTFQRRLKRAGLQLSAGIPAIRATTSQMHRRQSAADPRAAPTQTSISSGVRSPPQSSTAPRISL